MEQKTSQPSSSQAHDATLNLAGWNFDNTYSRLPRSLFVHVNPTKVRAPSVVVLNHQLAEALGLNLRELTESQAAQIFSGNELPHGAEPLAQAYAGHQFGGFTMLGDGRAILLGEQMSPSDLRFDIQLKGSGPTPFSRRGDGRAAVGPMLREYIISEAMAALGIPTTRSLAVVRTGEPVYRERVLQGAVLTRVAASHIRVGTFEYVAARQNVDELKSLADYSIARHYPELVGDDDSYRKFLHAVMDRQAALVARWQLVGFVHGVMNTDNVAISGESIDYGPCAFMNVYDPATVFSSIDTKGRYAYGNQPTITHWNIVRFAESLLSLLGNSEEAAIEYANGAIQEFPEMFRKHWMRGMRAKLGLQQEHADDESLFTTLLDWMYDFKMDFTNTFRQLSDPQPPKGQSYQDERFQTWYQRWSNRLELEQTSNEGRIVLMKATNPGVIPRNHLVEEALTAASDLGDLSVMTELVDVLRDPYVTPQNATYTEPPPASACGYQTFCGT